MLHRIRRTEAAPKRPVRAAAERLAIHRGELELAEDFERSALEREHADAAEHQTAADLVAGELLATAAEHAADELEEAARREEREEREEARKATEDEKEEEDEKEDGPTAKRGRLV